MFIGDYHTHTTFSDGKGRVLDNAWAAKNKGLKEVAITDHAFHVFPKGKYVALQKQCREAEKETGVKVFAGIEADITSLEGDVDIPEEWRDSIEYMLVGFHKFAPPKNLVSFFKMYFVTYFNGLIPTSKKNRERNARIIIEAISRYPIKALVHINHSLKVDVGLVARACAEKNVLLELNAKHLNDLNGWWSTLVESGVKFILNTDAHRPSDVGCLNKALERVLKEGISPERIVNYCGE